MEIDANALITPLMAAFLGLALNEAAYMAEIVRAGIVSVQPGQHQAAAALGMTRLQTMRRIVLPQAMRVIIPPTGNQTIAMLKTSSLVSVLAIPELLYSAQIIYSRTFETIPLLLVVSIWYLLATSILTVVQARIERHFSPDSHGARRAVPAAAVAEPDDPATAAGVPMSALPLVRAEQVHKRYGRNEVLKGIDLTVEAGEVLCVVGPSGSGKSTFLRCVNHLEQINEGRLWVDGGARRLPPGRRPAPRAQGARDRAPARRHRDGVPALQPVLALHGAGERDGRPDAGPPRGAGHGRARTRASCSRGSAWPTRSTATRGGSRAASSSGSRSPARSRCGRS